MRQFIWKMLVRITNPSCTIKASALGKDLKLEKGVTIQAGSVVSCKKVGKYTYINRNTLIDKNVESIGRFCSIAYGCKLGLGSHPTNWVSSHPFSYQKKYGFVSNDKLFGGESKKPCVIGHDVWIGANAIVLAGVTVGDGAIIGANALVSEDVEAYSIVTGTPAKHTRFRFDDETCKKLHELAWWDWDDKKLKENIGNFDDPSKWH